MSTVSGQLAPWTIRPRQLAPDLQTTGAHMKTPMLRWTYIFLCSYDKNFLKEEAVWKEG